MRIYELFYNDGFCCFKSVDSNLDYDEALTCLCVERHLSDNGSWLYPVEIVEC